MEKFKTFYWNTNKNFVLDVLSYEFNYEFEIEDSSWKNDGCPSLLLKFETYTMQLFLPSNYEGEYSEYCLMVNKSESDFEDDKLQTNYLLTNLNDVIEQLKNYL
jgi:hypothetical protein